MADFNSSLPIKTQAAGDVAVKVSDATVTSQQLAIDSSGRVTTKLNDGSGNAITSTSSALDVNIKSGGATPVADKTAFTYGTTTDTVVAGVFQDTSPTLTAGQSGAVRLTASRAVHNNLRDSSGNELLGSKVSAASVPTVIASDQAAIPVKLQDGSGSSVTKGQTTMSASLPVAIASDQSAIAVKNQDGSGNAITSQVNGSARALDIGVNVAGVQVDPRSIRALTSTDVVTANIKDATGTAFSVGNPLPVSLQATAGTVINNYSTSAALAAAATANHDYTVTALKTLTLKQLHATASGKLKIEVQVETASGSGTFNTIFVGFNSTANPNIDIPLSANPAVVAGARVRIIRTNNDASSQDVYSTISGSES